MFTHSQMVDAMVAECRRPDMVAEISRYVNQTIRELHFTDDRNAAIFYEENFREAQVVATVESGQQWEIPNPTIFQKLAAVRFPTVFDRNGDEVWARLITPGPHMKQFDHYGYRSGGTFVFYGYGGVNSQIDLAYYQFPSSLVYKAVASRPASYDEEAGWSYPPEVNTPELQAAAQMLVTNWLLMRWNQVVAEGVRAKVYKRISDTDRSRTSYSLYSSLRHGLWSSEVATIFGDSGNG